MPAVVAFGTLVLLVFLLWFALGTQRNISRGNVRLRWLQDGLSQLGPRTTVRWRGSSVVQLDLVEPRAPLSGAQVSVVLEPRDLSWLWAWSRARGRRDFLILRGTLPGQPRFELEAGGDRGWTARDRLKQVDPAWVSTTWDDLLGPVEVAHSGATGGEVAAVEQVWRALTVAAAGPVWRLSIRQDAPHLEVHLEPPPPPVRPPAGPDAPGAGAEVLIAAFRRLADLAGG